MIRKVLILFLLVTHAVSDSCVRYTFEEDIDEFTNELGTQCGSRPFWIVGKYSTLDLTSQDERSTSFITPLPDLSCVSSFIFSMNVGGTIEVIIYMEAADPSDQIIVLANLLDIVTGDRATGTATNLAMDPNFVSGWHTLKMTLTGSDTYDGYLSIMGSASPDSIVLVDSFRYIPPDMDESLCQIYEEIATTPVPTTMTTPDPTTVTIPDPTTVTTPDPTTITESTTITTVTDSETSTPTTTSSDTKPTETDSEDTDAPAVDPCPTPPIDADDTKGFWTPLTITMLVLLYCIVLALICLLFYEIGRRRARAAADANNLDFENLPSSFKVPRVKKVYPDAKTNPYARNSL